MTRSRRILAHGSAAGLLIAGLLMQHAAGDDAVIVPFGSPWKWLNPTGVLDDPGLADPEFDKNWFQPRFDDSAWSGPRAGPFQYGMVNGLVLSEPFPLVDPGDGDRFTSYFRHRFTTNESATNLAIEFIADDGAVFYLDGREVLRHNCCVDELDVPAGDDYANFAILPGNEDFFRTRRILTGQPLAPGDHLLAISVHQTTTISDDLGFEMQLVSQDPGSVVIDRGIDTTLAQKGLGGPDRPHGAAGQNPDGVERWEWDALDVDGENHGLLWFDIPQEVLDAFNYGHATLRLHVDNEGHSADLHRMTADWLSGPDGGNNVTWNNIPGGPGIVSGRNAEPRPSTLTKDVFGLEGKVIEVDVTEDVLAWSQGKPNYGWGFLPGGVNGTGITSLESVFDPVPELVIIPGEGGPFLQAGDADQDLDFDQRDLVQVLTAAKYRTGQPATWGEGDWNGAPGGRPGSPPVGDGVFNQLDLIAAASRAVYLTGPYAAIAPQGIPGGGQVGAVELTSIPIPEPSTLLLLTLGVVILALTQRRAGWP
jgi:hypothetical protein